VSVFVLDASYTLTWCFADRATVRTDECLRRMESHVDRAIVPWVWQLEVGNALGKTVVRKKLLLDRALEIWEELLLLPIQPLLEMDVSSLLRLAVRHNLSIYDASYLHAALLQQLPLATNDQILGRVALASGLDVFTP
jgi:predicted nucleic acid-binding protein